MCDCDAPTVYRETVRRAQRRHRCGECAAFIDPGQHYWEFRGLWDGRWAGYRTCGACKIIGNDLADCFCFGDLAEGLEYGLRERYRGGDERIAYAGMLRRRRHAERILREEARSLWSDLIKNGAFRA